MENSHSDYNEEAVFYCADCLSLRIMATPWGTDCCDECGGTDIKQASIEEWEELYREKYHKNFIN